MPYKSLLGYFRGSVVIFKFFSVRAVNEFASFLAGDVARRYPPAIANNPAQTVSQQRLSDILEEVFARATEFSRGNELNWYQRAMLRNNFRWELNELGYDEKFVDIAAEDLILHVTRSPSQKS